MRPTVVRAARPYYAFGDTGFNYLVAVDLRFARGEAVAAAVHLSSQEILTRLVQAGDDWGQSRLADDDVTFVVLKIR